MTIEYRESLERAKALVDTTDSRVLLGICGAPGAGKTYLAERLVADLNVWTPSIAAHVPMDGFHLANATLARLGRTNRKGALDTFDGWGYGSLVQRLRDDTTSPVYAPNFDRTLEEPIAGSIEVAPQTRVVVSEGNYLLVPEQPWGAMRSLLTEVWFCAVPEDVRIDRLVRRHMTFGRSEIDAHRWAVEVDGPNAMLIESLRNRADVDVSTAAAAFS